MEIPNKHQFMQVKQKLDQHRLPTTFPPQATNLIAKLLGKIQEKQILLTDRTRPSLKSSPLSPRNTLVSQQSQINNKDEVAFVLQTKIRKLLRQNSLLSQQLMQNKEHVELLKQCKQLQSNYDQIQRKSINTPKSPKSTNNQINFLRNGFEVLKAREIELLQELTQLKYKYNQSMDFLHQNPLSEKLYIKRLLKHKKIEISSSQQNHNAINNQNYFQYPSDKINPNADINKIQTENYKLFCLNSTLRLKVQHRQIQILRLQHQMTEEFNINGIITAYHFQQKNKEIISLKDQIQILLAQNHPRKLKEDLSPAQSKHYQKENKKQAINSPPINTYRSPAKNPQKRILNGIIDTKKTNTSQVRKQMKSPASKSQIQILRKENDKLKKQIEILRNKSNQINKVDQIPMNNQAIKTRIQKSLSPQTFGKYSKNKMIPTLEIKKNEQFKNKQLEKAIKQHEEEINLLRGQLIQKNALIKMMEIRWQNQKQENKVLISELSQKKLYAQNLTKQNNFIRQKRMRKEKISNQGQMKRVIKQNRNDICEEKDYSYKFELNQNQTQSQNQLQEVRINMEGEYFSTYDLRQKITQLNFDNRRQLQLKEKLNSQEKRLSYMEKEQVQTIQSLKDNDSKVNYMQQVIKLNEKKITSIQVKNQQLKQEIRKLQQQNLQLRKENQKLTLTQLYQQKSKNQTTSRKQQTSVNISQEKDNNSQLFSLKNQIQLLQTKIHNQNQTISQLNNYIQVHRHEKQKISLEKLNLQKENEFIKIKMQELQRALSIQAEQMKNYRQTLKF